MRQQQRQQRQQQQRQQRRRRQAMEIGLSSDRPVGGLAGPCRPTNRIFSSSIPGAHYTPDEQFALVRTPLPTWKRRGGSQVCSDERCWLFYRTQSLDIPPTPTLLRPVTVVLVSRIWSLCAKDEEERTTNTSYHHHEWYTTTTNPNRTATTTKIQNRFTGGDSSFKINWR
jgi:hypothetical protein